MQIIAAGPAHPAIIAEGAALRECAPRAARRCCCIRSNPQRHCVGEWLSLVEHLVRDQGVGGSNPLSPTNTFNGLQPLIDPARNQL